MLKQLTTTLVILLSLGMFINSCDDSNPTFKDPDPLDTGSNSFVPDSLKPDTSDNTDPSDSMDNEPNERLKLAVHTRFDSQRDNGSVKEVPLTAVNVKIYESLNNQDEPTDLIDSAISKEIDNTPDGDFANNTQFPNRRAYAIFQNMDENIPQGVNVYFQIEPAEYQGATIVTKPGPQANGNNYLIQNTNNQNGWQEITLVLEEQ